MLSQEREAIKKRKAYARNPDKFREKNRAYRATPEGKKVYNQWQAARRAEKPWVKLYELQAGMLQKWTGKSLADWGWTLDTLLGCSAIEACGRIEEQFEDGMGWEHWGWGEDRWNLDHRVPRSQFDRHDPVQVLAACHWSNLQPLWQVDHDAKSLAEQKPKGPTRCPKCGGVRAVPGGWCTPCKRAHAVAYRKKKKAPPAY